MCEFTGLRLAEGACLQLSQRQADGEMVEAGGSKKREREKKALMVMVNYRNTFPQQLQRLHSSSL